MLENLPNPMESAVAHCDLEGDGNQEILLTFGTFSTAGQAAVVNSDGSLRWVAPEGDGGFAYPLCRDVNGDTIKDMLTAGRGGDLTALSGVDGSVIWRLSDMGFTIEGYSFAPVEVDGDERVFLATGGGFNNERNPGRITVLAGDFSVEAQWAEPNEAEIWAAPAATLRGDGSIDILVGSGGESLTGSLYWLNYDPMSGTFNQLHAIDSSCLAQGFMASATFVDVDNDGTLEAAAVDACGRGQVIDRAGGVRWFEDSPSPFRFSVSYPFPADLDGDGSYDLVFAFNNANPELAPSDPFTRVLALRGSDGAMLWERTGLGELQSAALGSADHNADGIEDIIVPDPSEDGQMRVLNGSDGSTLDIRTPPAPFGGSPISDVDGDGTPEMFTLKVLDGKGLLYRHDFNFDFDPGASYSGFRGRDVHDGVRP